MLGQYPVIMFISLYEKVVGVLANSLILLQIDIINQKNITILLSIDMILRRLKNL